MEIIKVSATRREESGKGPSGRLRRSGLIPAVAYGRELAATPVALSPKALIKVLSSDHGKNSVIELQIEGGDAITVMVRDYAYHPITRELVHADFVQVKLDQPVDVEIPMICVGKAKGLVRGGVLQQIYRRLPMRCLPDRIPSRVELDVTELDIGDARKAGSIVTPEGVTILLADDQTIAVLNAPEKATEEDIAAAAAAAPAAGAAAAPAAAPAAKAKGK